MNQALRNHDDDGFQISAWDCSGRVQWTPQLVEARMVEAFKALQHAARVGPRSFGSNWPLIIREKEEIEQAQRFDDEEAQRAGHKGEIGRSRVRVRLYEDQISRMEEALGWPGLLLERSKHGTEKAQHADERLADSLNLWARCKAMGVNMDPILLRREAKAAALVDEMHRSELERVEGLRRQKAAEVANWANGRRWQSDGTQEHIERIDSNARIRIDREVRDMQPRQIKRSDAMPNRALNRTMLDKYRKQASTLISEILARRGVLPRMPAEF